MLIDDLGLWFLNPGSLFRYLLQLNNVYSLHMLLISTQLRLGSGNKVAGGGYIFYRRFIFETALNVMKPSIAAR